MRQVTGNVSDSFAYNNVAFCAFARQSVAAINGSLVGDLPFTRLALEVIGIGKLKSVSQSLSQISNATNF
jgi:hypothetical protein